MATEQEDTDLGPLPRPSVIERFGIWFWDKNGYLTITLFILVFLLLAAAMSYALNPADVQIHGVTIKRFVIIGYVTTFFLGFLVGMAELMSRYRGSPGRAVITTPGAIYILSNGVLALSALFLIRNVFGDAVVGPKQDPAELMAQQVLLASFGAMAFFRSGLVTYRSNGQDLPIGPGLVLNLFLKTLDNLVDRKRAGERMEQATEIMSGISFQRAKSPLVKLCLSSMQNESTEDEDKLKKTVADIEAQDGTSDAQRAVYLGLAIWDLVGRSGLKEAVKAFSKDLQAGNFTRSTLIAKQMHPLTLSQSITTLPKFAGLLAGVTDEAKLSKIKGQIDSFANVAGVQDDFVKLQIGLLIAATYNDEILKEAVETILSGQ